MRKVSNSYSQSYKYINLYLDDIIAIINILSEVNKNEKPQIRINDYYLDDINEINDNNFKEIEKLELSVNNPRIELSLKYDHAINLSTNQIDSTFVYGIISKIDKIVRDRLSLKSKIFTSKIFGPIIFACFIINRIMVHGQISNSFVTLSTFLLMIFSMIVVVRSAKISSGYCTIVGKYKKDAPNFFERNKDQFLINFIFTIIGAIIGWFAQKFFG